MSFILILAGINVYAENETAIEGVEAKAGILIEQSTGKVLREMNADEKLPIASVTKIMTMLLVAEAIDENKITLADKVACSANAASKGGSQIWLEEGESMTVDEMKQYIRDHMAKHKVPKYIDFVDSFPMNAAGKILKYQMREDAVKKLNIKKVEGIVAE